MSTFISCINIRQNYDGILTSKLSHGFSKKFHKVAHETGAKLNLKKASSLFPNSLAIELIKWQQLKPFVWQVHIRQLVDDSLSNNFRITFLVILIWLPVLANLFLTVKRKIKGRSTELKERAGIEAKTSPSNVLELVVAPSLDFQAFL